MSVISGDPLLVLFLVAGAGYLVGRIRIGSFRLGPAAVLFTGLALSALDPKLTLPDFVYTFGLTLFVYTTALSCGPTFLHVFRRRGLAANALVGGAIATGAALAVGAHALLGTSAARTAGLFTGSLTNTPALGGVLEWLKLHGAAPSVANEPVVAYSLTYPFGVIGVLVAITLMQRRWRAGDAAVARETPAEAGKVTSRTAVVRRPDVEPLDEARVNHGWQVSFGRVEQHGHQRPAAGSVTVAPGDLVTVVGSPHSVEEVIDFLGEPVSASAADVGHDVDYRRIFVSNPRRAGQTVAELDLAGRFGAVVTRVRRGDVDLVAEDDTVLELGDRVRVVASKNRMDDVSRWFGDSYRSLSEMEITTFSLGVALGLLLGAVKIPLPGGGIFSLGFAGGTLIVGLILGAVRRTGPVVWQPPYGVNLTLRQVGTVMFLAGIGTRAGPSFASTVHHGHVFALLLAGALITAVVALLVLQIGHSVLHIPTATLLGIVAGAQTQPAVLAFALEQTRDENPNVGYTTVYPLALISKIVLAQLLVLILT